MSGPSPSKPIALPSLPQHLREFAARRGAWASLARNLIPVVGIHAFGWSVGLAVFNYWFDGLAAVCAIVAAMVPRALRETTPAAAAGAGTQVARGAFTWLLLVAIVGLPYWIVLIPLNGILLSAGLWRAIFESPALCGTFFALAAGHFWRAFHAGYDTMPEQELKQRVRWDLYLLILRAMAMFIMAAHGLGVILVPLMALLLTYFEVWPERALGAVFGDPARLWEYDPEKRRPPDARPGRRRGR
jgi:hypothetical protein